MSSSSVVVYETPVSASAPLESLEYGFFSLNFKKRPNPGGVASGYAYWFETTLATRCISYKGGKLAYAVRPAMPYNWQPDGIHSPSTGLRVAAPLKLWDAGKLDAPIVLNPTEQADYIQKTLEFEAFHNAILFEKRTQLFKEGSVLYEAPTLQAFSRKIKSSITKPKDVDEKSKDPVMYMEVPGWTSILKWVEAEYKGDALGWRTSRFEMAYRTPRPPPSSNIPTVFVMEKVIRDTTLETSVVPIRDEVTKTVQRTAAGAVRWRQVSPFDVTPGSELVEWGRDPVGLHVAANNDSAAWKAGNLLYVKFKPAALRMEALPDETDDYIYDDSLTRDASFPAPQQDKVQTQLALLEDALSFPTASRAAFFASSTPLALHDKAATAEEVDAAIEADVAADKKRKREPEAEAIA